MAKDKMNYYITAHPINRKLQEELGIYNCYTDGKGNCKSQSVGKVVGALVADGCTHIHSFVDAPRKLIVMHLSAK